MKNFDILGNIVRSSNVYDCTNYGVLTGNTDNSKAFQKLIDLIYDNGGGIIFIPAGTYLFDTTNNTGDWTGTFVTSLCELKSGVSIIGESLTHTILKCTGNTSQGCSLFSSNSEYSGEILTGCTYSNFTVDMQEASLTTYTHRGKAFYTSGMKDCVLRDLRCLGTPSTSIGIDMLDNVVLDSIYVYQGGRQWETNGSGGAGIGIGSGKWQNENYIIRNCVCDECGHFGIFIEDQGLFKNHTQNYPKGQIISNNIIRNGRNYGIGLRGGKNVLITGNLIYENIGGIYTDFGAKYATFSNNHIADNTGAAFEFGSESNVNTTTYPCDNIVIINNVFMNNGSDIVETVTPTNTHQEGNIIISNL